MRSHAELMAEARYIAALTGGRGGAVMTALTQNEIAEVIRRSNPRNLSSFELDCWQAAIDSQLALHLPVEFGGQAVALIERGICTLARRSYCRAPRPASLGSPPPIPERRRRPRVPVS